MRSAVIDGTIVLSYHDLAPRASLSIFQANLTVGRFCGIILGRVRVCPFPAVSREVDGRRLAPPLDQAFPCWEPPLRPVWTVVSDLHLFAERSKGRGHTSQIIEAARRSELLVLNGDIFDFDWSTLGSIERTADAAEKWIRALVSACPDCEILYLLGNHDGVRAWAERLDHLADDLPAFRWSPAYCRRGNTLFTHGDLLLGPSSQTARAPADEVERRAPLLGKLYAAASDIGIPRLLCACYGVRRALRALERNLVHLDEVLTRGLERLC